MSPSKPSKYKTSFDNNPNFIPIFSSQEPCEPNISHNATEINFLKSMYQFVTLNENGNVDKECPKNGQLPNYVVPVLYVPHRIVTNEELQRVALVPHAEPHKENIPSKNKSNIILSDSEAEIYNRLTDKLRGAKMSKYGDDYTRCKKNCSKTQEDYNNPYYSASSISENCFMMSNQNKTNSISSVSAKSNDASYCAKDSTQHVSNIKPPSKNKNSTISTWKTAKRYLKKVHSKGPKRSPGKLHPSDFVSHVQSKFTQTNCKTAQILTETRETGDDTLFYLKSDSKNNTSSTNAIESLAEDPVEFARCEDLIDESFIPVIYSPLDEMMAPKLRTHNNNAI